MLYLIMAAIFAACMGGSYYQGRQDGEAKEIAKAVEENQLMQSTRELAMQGAADAIAKIDVKQVTIQGRIQKEIQTNVVYRDCVNTPDGLRSLNDALTNTDSGPVGGVKLPAASAPR